MYIFEYSSWKFAYVLYNLFVYSLEGGKAKALTYTESDLVPNHHHNSPQNGEKP